jgi:hypothetical protein
VSNVLEVLMSKRASLVAAVLALTMPAFAHGNERGEAKATIGGKPVVIEYGRPTLAGRDMLGRAEVGKPWRMGKDAVTTLKTDADLSLGGTAVPKGTYVLTATKVSDDKWLMNVATNDAEKKTVADLPLTVSKLPASVETFTIDLKGEKDKGEVTLSWGTTALKGAFTGK